MRRYGGALRRLRRGLSLCPFPLDNLFYQYGETGTYEYLRRITKVTSPQKRKESNKRKLISCLEENSSTFLRVRLETVGVAFQQ